MPEIATALNGKILAECFSQDKDELVFGFCDDGKQWRHRRDVYLRATLRPDLAALSFPEDFRRAGKNTVNLFGEILDKPVLGLRTFLNERAFAIDFSDDYSLIFKLFGNRSNVLLLHEGEILSLFHNNRPGETAPTDRSLQQTFEDFTTHKGDWRKLFPTFGKEASNWLEAKNYLEKDITQRWELVQEVLKVFHTPQFFVDNQYGSPVLTMFPPNMPLNPQGGLLDGKPNASSYTTKAFSSPIEATNAFFSAFFRKNIFEVERGAALRILEKKRTKLREQIAAGYEKLTDKDGRYEEIGHILMAHLHLVPERAGSIKLPDFYREGEVEIKLKTDISPQKNAERYYKKAKNETIEGQFISETIQQKETELADTDALISDISGITQLKLLRKFLKEKGLLASAKQDTPASELFKYFKIDGYEIFVGRNATNNDLLTKRYARKDDLWLHARDVTGSHVVIRHQAGKKFPARVIERAAELAAYFSKRRNEGLCPVIVTPKKFVRKTKDLLEGQVIIEKEEVVMVAPRL